jgi:hypothetical protein
MDAVDALEEPVGEPSADAQEAVRAAVAAAVPSAKAVNRRRQTGGALHSLAEAAPTQGRLSRMGVAAGSPLATGGGHVVVPAPTATAWPSGSLGVTVPGGGFGAPVPSFMAPAAGQPMAQAYPTAGATAIPQVMGSVYPAAGGMTPPGMAGPVYPTTGGLNQPQPLGQPPAYGSYSSGPLPAVTTPFEPLKPSYSSLARLSTRPVTQPKVHHSWIMELVFACSGLVMVVVAAVVWTRIHERIQECVGGCPDLDSVIDAVQFNGWSIIGLSALAMVLAGFSLRTTRGTDAVRALGSLVLVASVATIVLGALVLATSLP